MKFEKIRIHNGFNNIPHFQGLKKVFKGSIGKNQYTILYSEIENYIHIRVHCGISKIADWNDLQLIKNWLIGEESVAVQVFPKASELVNKGNTYHIFSWDGLEVPNLGKLYKYAESESHSI